MRRAPYVLRARHTGPVLPHRRRHTPRLLRLTTLAACLATLDAATLDTTTLDATAATSALLPLTLAHGRRIARRAERTAAHQHLRDMHRAGIVRSQPVGHARLPPVQPCGGQLGPIFAGPHSRVRRSAALIQLQRLHCRRTPPRGATRRRRRSRVLQRAATAATWRLGRRRVAHRLPARWRGAAAARATGAARARAAARSPPPTAELRLVLLLDRLGAERLLLHQLCPAPSRGEPPRARKHRAWGVRRLGFGVLGEHRLRRYQPDQPGGARQAAAPHRVGGFGGAAADRRHRAAAH